MSKKFLTANDIANDLYPEHIRTNSIKMDIDKGNNQSSRKRNLTNGQYTKNGIDVSYARKIINKIKKNCKHSGIRHKPHSRAYLVPVKTYAKFVIHNYRRGKRHYHISTKKLRKQVTSLQKQINNLKLQLKILSEHYGMNKYKLLKKEGKVSFVPSVSNSKGASVPAMINIAGQQTINEWSEKCHQIAQYLLLEAQNDAKHWRKLEKRDNIFPTYSKMLNKYHYQKLAYTKKYIKSQKVDVNKKLPYNYQDKIRGKYIIEAERRFNYLWRDKEKIDLTHINYRYL